MRLYEVTEADTVATLSHPEQIDQGAFGARHAWKQFPDGRWLRVTFIEEGAQRVVITVTPKRHGPGGHDAH